MRRELHNCHPLQVQGFQDLWQVYQNRSECHVMVILHLHITPLRLVMITSELKIKDTTISFWNFLAFMLPHCGILYSIFGAFIMASFIISQMTTFLGGFHPDIHHGHPFFHPLCRPVSSVTAYLTFFNLNTFSDQVIQLSKHRNFVHLMANHRCWKYVVQMDLRMHGSTSLSSEELWVAQCST